MSVPEWNGVFGVNCMLARLKILGVPEPIYYVQDGQYVRNQKPKAQVRKTYSELSIRQQRKRWRHFCEYVERSIAQKLSQV